MTKKHFITFSKFKKNIFFRGYASLYLAYGGTFLFVVGEIRRFRHVPVGRPGLSPGVPI